MHRQTEIIIRGYHLDVYGHVNNARYLEFLEEDRWAFFDGLLEAWADEGLSFVVVNINISYKSPALLNTIILVNSAISRYGKRSCVITQTITDKQTGTLIAEADVTFVITDASGAALPVEGRLSDTLKAL